MNAPRVSLEIDPAAMSRGLTRIAVLLVALSVSGQVVKFGVPGVDDSIINKFDLAKENNLPTFFATLLLLIVAGLAALIWASERSGRSRFAIGWAGLAAVFFLMAIDEAASFHEMLIRPIREGFGLGGLLYYAWVGPALAFLAIFGLAYFRFWRQLPRPIRSRFAVAAILFVGGAVGVECVEGRSDERHGTHTPIFSALTTVEESLEMAGLLVLIQGLLTHLGTKGRPIELRVAGRDPALDEPSEVEAHPGPTKLEFARIS